MSSWNKFLSSESKLDYYKKLMSLVDISYSNGEVYPKRDNIFKAFTFCPYDILKVVLLGQDPYHTPNMADGLAFSTKIDKKPPSLQNIFKEIKSSTRRESICINSDLSALAKQGVLLLNTILTVDKGKAYSHSSYGWEIFTDHVIEYINSSCNDIIFLLWGSHAQSKESLIDNSKHHILKAPHPSPLSAYRGFIGCNHFSIVNNILKDLDKETIEW